MHLLAAPLLTLLTFFHPTAASPKSLISRIRPGAAYLCIGNNWGTHCEMNNNPGFCMTTTLGDQYTVGSVGPEPDTTCMVFSNEACDLYNTTHPPIELNLRFPGRADLKDKHVRSLKCKIEYL